MLHILGFFFLLIFLILLGVVLVVIGFVRSLFGGKKNFTYKHFTGKGGFSDYPNENGEKTTLHQPDSDSKNHKKFFDKDDGEYVDFEEIK